MQTYDFYKNTCDDLDVKAKSEMWKACYFYLLNRIFLFTNTLFAGKVLDVGSGSAKISEFFPTSVTYVGVDISPEVIDIARKRYPHKSREFVATNANNLSMFKDNEFDAVICTEMLEHLHYHEWRDVLLEIRRVAKPGAKIVFSMPNLFYLWAYIPWSFWPFKRRLKLSDLWEGMKDGASYERYFTSESVEAPFHRRISPQVLKSILSVFFIVDHAETTYWYNNQVIHGFWPKFQMFLLRSGFTSKGVFGSQNIVQCTNY